MTDASPAIGARSVGPAESLVHDVLGATVAGSASRVGLVHGDRSFTHRELRSDVSALARGLRENFEPGELLAIWLGNGVEIVHLLLACLETGVVPMPLHQGMKWPEVRAALERSKAGALVASIRAAGRYAEEPALARLRRVFVVGEGPMPGTWRSYAEFVARPGDGAPTPVPSDRMGLVLHTSGSDGRAKGVMLSHAAVERVLDDRRARARLGAESVLVVASCLTQSVGLYQSLAVLAAGGTLVLLESYDVDGMVEAVHRHRPTHLLMVVDAFDRLLHDPRITSASLGSLAFACAGADRVTARVQDRFLGLTGRPLAVSYGLTESSWALVNPGERVDKRLALGRAGHGVEVRLRRSDGREASVDEVGEICVRSPRTMLGYLGDDAATREVLVDGWLATGDLARRDAEGFVWFAGRRKNMIVLGSGDNVSPLEVENVILSHPSVTHCTVMGVAIPGGSEEPHALVTRRDPSLSEASLAEFLRERLSDFKVPRRIRFVAERAIGPTGKIRGRRPRPDPGVPRCPA